MSLEKKAARIAKKYGFESKDVLWLLEGGLRKGEIVRLLEDKTGIVGFEGGIVCDLIGDPGRR